MISQINSNNAEDLYRYFKENSRDVPYYFKVNYNTWRESMFNDTDYDGKQLFSHLETYQLVSDNVVQGFIQFGLSNFVFDESGSKDYNRSYLIIRNLHFLPEAEKANLLIEKANDFFESVGTSTNERYAFFHFFGMSCFARQGKLHSSHYHVEKLLREYGFNIEHENVYYTKCLNQIESKEDSEIYFSKGNNEQTIHFLIGSQTIGGCELNTKFSTDICFLKWIFINDEYAHQGLGTRCMNKLFSHLKQKGFVRLDTDTSDKNITAQGYYIKTGFTDKGRMRSYQIL